MERKPMTQAEKFSLEIKRFIKAPRDRVYAAWTDPAQLKQWFGPENVQTHDLIADARVGGNFRWHLSNPEGEKVTVRGKYRELQPGKKIVFTWQFEDDEDWEDHISVITVDLEDAEGGTELRLTHEQLPSEDSRDRHTQGWNSVLNKLERFVSK
jgi:glutathione S-transferase